MCIVEGHSHGSKPAVTAEGFVTLLLVVVATVACYNILTVAWPILLPLWATAVVIVWMPCWARAALRAAVSWLMHIVGHGVAATTAAVTEPRRHDDPDAITAPTMRVVLRNKTGEIVGEGVVPVINGSRSATLAEVTARYVARQNAIAGRPR